MASFFNRPTYTASWANQRIYPRQEPSFDAPTSPSSRGPPLPPQEPVLSESRTLPDGRTLRFVDTPSPASPPSAPPPLYFPGQARRSSLSPADLPAGHAPSTNTASALHARVVWAYHPLLARGKRRWVRWFRVRELWRCLAGQKEVLWDGWPREFGGRELPPGMQDDDGDAGGDEEEAAGGPRRRSGSRSRSRSLSLSLSRRTTNGADSGVGLTPRPTMSLEVQHPLYPLYKTRIAELNDIIGENLYITRAWMAFLEIGTACWVIALIIALATGGGKQTGFLKGVEIALVLVILLVGTGVNAVRMRRFTLSRLLRQKQRDWSPLPTTLSTTNAQLMRNYLDGDVRDHNGTGDVASAMPKDRASLRWRLRETEGSPWLSFRPIIHVELVTPASAANPLAYLPVVDLSEGGEEAPPPAVVDIYPPTGGEGRTSSRREEVAEEREGRTTPVPVGAPPGYEEALR